ncbi:type II toxin-antitoxin system RelE/ParE family toxin [Ruminococcus flavefaciens]|uniref:type II toxin-antitoxin system RelE/ParE family toxin n=1 Tax=Ruminococcus flavefaciens TaxID=1265 RepID=UPI0026F2E68B|nr:type II toxin-antitoxin system RelE/ParE family toxin [Ruminococcus flavefaciens]
MHEIVFYEDANGVKPVAEFLRELKASNSKDSRIRLNKCHDYINILKEYGHTVGEPYIKHLEDDIWELRPTRDRVLFAGIANGKYVLLHQFMKKTQKTPKREIEQAKRELSDFKRRSDIK